MLPIIFSNGFTTLLSISDGLAPGYMTITSAIGTLICGSSSLGIKNELYVPIIINATINKMVSFELMKKLAILPDIPSCMIL